MTLRNIFVLVIALAIAGFTAVYARNWLASERSAMTVTTEPVPVDTTSVLVAKRDLGPGTFIKPEDIKWQPWPEDGVIEDYAVKGERAMEDFLGTVVRSAITTGQPITDARVVHPGDRGFLAAVLTPGNRAVSVPVDDSSGVAGFVFPGDWVDVILTARVRVFNSEDNAKERVFSETLITDIRVLAIDQSVENEEGEANVGKTATLEVTPKQVEKIAIALELGILSLSLHSLSREQDRFAQIARAMGADPLESDITGSYTMDYDVYYMRDRFIQNRKKKKTINVLRGGESEQLNASED